MMRQMLLFMAGIPIILAASYGLALLGEPQSVWLWRLVGVIS